MAQVKKIMFLTGTRADFGKLKPLMLAVSTNPNFELHIFVTGMHMLTKYGYTCEEVERAGFKNVYRFINQNANDGMDHVLAKTISGLSDYVREVKPDLIIVHGDRVEAMAGAIVGALNNILTGHIEGGEVSGTIDELIRHAITKLSHVHFVANEQAQQRLIQLGESEETIHIIGSPDIDIMNSENLPSLNTVREHYQIAYHNYAILIFHPVTTELDFLKHQAQIIVDSLIRSEKNYIVIYPNNDSGTHFIFDEYKRLENYPNFRLLPSIRFEYFLTLLKNADFIIGNSSAGIREAPHFGVPAINIGSRQNNRTQSQLVINSPVNLTEIAIAIEETYRYPRKPESTFGNGNSANHFTKIINTDNFLLSEKQKHFVDRKIKR